MKQALLIGLCLTLIGCATTNAPQLTNTPKVLCPITKQNVGVLPNGVVVIEPEVIIGYVPC